MAIRFTPYNRATASQVPDYATAAARDQALESQNLIGGINLLGEGVRGYNTYMNKAIDPNTGAAGRTPIADALRDLKNTWGKEPDMEGAAGDLDDLMADDDLFGFEGAPDAATASVDAGADPAITALAPSTTSVVADAGIDATVDAGADMASAGGSSVPYGSIIGGVSDAAAGDAGGVAKAAVTAASSLLGPLAPLIVGPALDFLAPTEGTAQRESRSAADLAQARKADARAKALRDQRYA